MQRSLASITDFRRETLWGAKSYPAGSKVILRQQATLRMAQDVNSGLSRFKFCFHCQCIFFACSKNESQFQFEPVKDKNILNLLGL